MISIGKIKSNRIIYSLEIKTSVNEFPKYVNYNETSLVIVGMISISFIDINENLTTLKLLL